MVCPFPVIVCPLSNFDTSFSNYRVSFTQLDISFSNDGLSLLFQWMYVIYPSKICPPSMMACPLSKYDMFFLSYVMYIIQSWYVPYQWRCVPYRTTYPFPVRIHMSLIQIEDVLFQWWYVIQLRCILSQLWNVPYLLMICPVPMTVCPLCNAGHLVVYLSVDAVVVPEPSHCYLAAFQILPILWLPCIHLRRLWSVFHPTIINPLGCHLMVCTLSSYLCIYELCTTLLLIKLCYCFLIQLCCLSHQAQILLLRLWLVH